MRETVPTSTKVTISTTETARETSFVEPTTARNMVTSTMRRMTAVNFQSPFKRQTFSVLTLASVHKCISYSLYL